MKMKKVLLLLACVTVISSLSAQNLQNYTPSILFTDGQWDFKSFQNLYRQQSVFDGNGLKKQNVSDNQFFFTSINQFLYGINGQINVGFDVWVNHTSLPFGGDRENQTGLSLIGPKVKIAPFKSLNRLSIQTGYYFKAGDDFENRSADAENPFFFFANDRSLWLTQFFYDKPLNSEWQLFFQHAFWFNVVDDSFNENNNLQTQTSAFVNYFPNSKWTFYAMTEYFPTHYNSNEQEFSAFESFFVQSGLGTKYQLIPNRLELELLYTNFWMGSDQAGAGETFNLGIRFVNQ